MVALTGNHQAVIKGRSTPWLGSYEWVVPYFLKRLPMDRTDETRMQHKVHWHSINSLIEGFGSIIINDEKIK